MVGAPNDRPRGRTWKFALPLIRIPDDTRVRNVEHKHESSAKVVVVGTGFGTLYLKGPGGPEGDAMLLREWIGTMLADAFGLPTFHFGLLPRPFGDEDGDICLSDGNLLRRDAVFASRREPGAVWEGGSDQLEIVGNGSAFSRIVVFDTWVRNMDRYVERQSGRPHLNMGNVFISGDRARGEQPTLLAMDHTHVLVDEAAFHDGNGAPLVRDEKVYGCFPEFRAFLTEKDLRDSLDDLSAFSFEQVRNLVSSAPECWGMTSQKATSVASFLSARARFLAPRSSGQFL